LKTWKIGDIGEAELHLNDTMNEMFAAMSGDRNPVHFDKERMAKTHFKKPIANGIQGISCIGAAIVNLFVTDETIVIAIEQHNSFIKPIFVGDRIIARVKIDEVLEGNEYWLQCFVLDQDREICTSARFRVRTINA